MTCGWLLRLLVLPTNLVGIDSDETALLTVQDPAATWPMPRLGGRMRQCTQRVFSDSSHAVRLDAVKLLGRSRFKRLLKIYLGKMILNRYFWDCMPK
jgi:hypothetical protein